MSYILIVDDEPLVARSAQRLLEREKANLGIEAIFTENNGQAGLDRFRGMAGCILVVSDYDMPRMDGEELARTLRQEEHYQGPIAIISGGHTPERRERLAGLDVTCIDKPYDITLFRAYLQQTIRKG